MKIVFLNTENKCAYLFQETGMTPISFDKIYALKSILKNDPVVYISDAVITNASEIINLVNSLKDNNYTQDNYSNIEIDQEVDQNFNDPSNWNSSEEPLFIHPVSNKRILIPDMGSIDHNGNISGFTFQGYLDFKSLSYLYSIGFNDSHLIHSLISNGTLEIVPKSKVEILKASYIPSKVYNKKEYAKKYNQYNQYNKHKNIIIEDKIGDNTDIGSIGMNVFTPVGAEGFKGDDIIPIEVGSGASFKTGGSGNYGNEGSILRDI